MSEGEDNLPSEILYFKLNPFKKGIKLLGGEV